ncbi:MAG: hypothetical protein JWN62_1583 [Acidimicrobiales bacterium]|nr:hypothetical protein [Acidimicrobiales bacterium]
MAVIVAVVVIVIATRSDDSAKLPPAGPAVIQGPGTVTGNGGATALSSDLPASANSADLAGAGLGALQRPLAAAGTFNCTTPGSWTPFAELPLNLPVGEPAGGTNCTGQVLDLPFGYCSTAPCSEVPADWRVDVRPGVSADSLLMIVAPYSTESADFVCVVGLIPQPKQILAPMTSMDQACPTNGTSNSVDIPYVPPDTSDIYVPPPASVDIPNG